MGGHKGRLVSVLVVSTVSVWPDGGSRRQDRNEDRHSVSAGPTAHAGFSRGQGSATQANAMGPDSNSLMVYNGG
ncbi:hypothetical protein TIFTF001_040826 [Ficus carica]|uniref:Secreted protein n=1 Tax=Ficus carica TaxID=3494 RepID=A0AA88CQQ8_FICCA|nr:hypothetical protein TIFTF001_040826 [Ficus carica]